MFPPFGFSIQEFSICYYYCQKMAFVCEFQHTPLRKMIFFSMFHTSCGYEILGILYLTHLETRYGEAHSISTLKNGFFGLQNLVVPLGRWGKKHFCQL
jgi:hypothetical protein